eukprot:363768-Chlamydomonas_euryale.AAC.5
MASELASERSCRASFISLKNSWSLLGGGRGDGDQMQATHHARGIPTIGLFALPGKIYAQWRECALLTSTPPSDNCHYYPMYLVPTISLSGIPGQRDNKCSFVAWFQVSGRGGN